MGFAEFGEWLKDLLNMYLEYLKPWAHIDYYEEGVLLTIGKWPLKLKPGIYPKIPLLQYCHTVHVKEDTMESDGVTVTTLDGKTALVSGITTYEIHDSVTFLVRKNDSHRNMLQTQKAVISEYLEDITWENIKKKTTKNAIQKRLTQRFGELGVTVKNFDFTDKCELRPYKLFLNNEKSNLML